MSYDNVTTEMGSWSYRTGGTASTVEDSVAAVLDEYVGDFDFPGLVQAYRDAVNAALPEGVTLAGNDFYGPFLPGGEASVDWEGYPTTEDGRLDIAAIVGGVDGVGGVDINPLLARYDITAN